MVCGFSGDGVTAEKIGLGMVDRSDWVVMVTAGSSPVLKGDVVKGEAPAGILIWYECGVSGLLGVPVGVL